jgi:hypothetical protein
MTAPDRQAIRARAFLRRLLGALPPECRSLLHNAIAGKGGGSVVVVAVPEELRGHVPVALYFAGAPAPALRDALRDVWIRDDRRVVRIARAEGNCLLPMFHRAAFPLPDLPPLLTVWRGVRAANLERARRGMSWTTNRGFACWHATLDGHRKGAGAPLVVRRQVPRECVVYHNTCGHTGDEVILDAPIAGEVDGDEADWRAAAERCAATEAARLLESEPPASVSPTLDALDVSEVELLPAARLHWR